MNSIFFRSFLIVFFVQIFLLVSITAQSGPYLDQTPPGNIPVRLVPDNLTANSEWQYHGTPTFSPDGTEMYYAIYRFNPGGIEIWFTECVNGVWASPKKAPFSNDNYGNNNPYFSSSKDTLYFLSSRPSGPIFKVIRTNGTWSSPISLNIPIPTGYSTGWQFSIADNGNIYAELTKDGQEDLYIWRFVSGMYRSAEKLSTICSTELDFTPYIDPDERFIMFASRRTCGFGNTDIYVSKKNLDGTWATPINLGQTINSGDVISPIISRDGKYFFFEAWMPNVAGGNPYWVNANVVFNLITDVKHEQKEPKSFNLYQNYPNPFNPVTTINYSLSESTHVVMTIFNSLGQEVARLVDETKPAGNYSVEFNAADFNSGVYFYSITTDNFSSSRKMLLVK